MGNFNIYPIQSTQIFVFAFLWQSMVAGLAKKGVTLLHLIANQFAVCVIST